MNRPEVLDNVYPRPLGKQPLPGLFIGFDIRPPETLDGLLGVSHQEKLSGVKLDLFPAVRFSSFFRQEKDHLHLKRVGVLKFVHQDVTEFFLKILPLPEARGK